MDVKDILRTFCKKHGYTWSFGYNNVTSEYKIILSQGDDNAGAFMSKEELKNMNDNELQNLLEMLHKGFQQKFNR